MREWGASDEPHDQTLLLPFGGMGSYHRKHRLGHRMLKYLVYQEEMNFWAF